MVGCVILGQDNNLIAEGYHQKAGEDHAEIVALRKAGKRAINSILYVNLEPCAHYGLTPPCVKAIIEHRVKMVVIGGLDPNAKVNGKGVRILQEAGIKTIVGVLEQECFDLNKIFFHWITKQKPFVSLKVAATLDGKIAHPEGKKWITGLESRQKVHELRAAYDAILTGNGTILADNPRLTVRKAVGLNPVRVILDRRGLCQPDLQIFQEAGQNLIFTSVPNCQEKYPTNTEIVTWSGSLEEVLAQLGQKKITSVLLEAGTNLNSAFLRENLVDEILYFINPCLAGDLSMPSCYLGPVQNFTIKQTEFYGQDLLITLNRSLITFLFT